MKYPMCWTSVAALTIPFMVAPAWAQVDPTAAEAAETEAAPAAAAGTSEIIVTARRRQESLQKVPVSVAAFDSQALQAQGIRTESDLQIATPGLTARATVNDNQLNFSIRGQSTEMFSGISPAVLAYVNEVQVAQNTSTSFFDLQNVQVLKGPQGTLFGRNTTGGAVLYQTQKPTNEFGGYLLGRTGNYGALGVQGAINIPIVDDAVLLRIAGDYDKRDGYVYNAYVGNFTGAKDGRALRVSLTLKPAAGLTNDFVWQHGRYGGTNAANVLYSVNGCGSTNAGYTLVSAYACLFQPGNPAFDAYVAANPGAYPGGFAAAVGLSRSLGKFKSYNNVVSPDHDARSDVITNTLAYEVSPSLTIKNITGYVKSHSIEIFDIDASPYIIFESIPLGEEFRTKQFSNELQFSGELMDKRLTYIAGAYYSHQKNENGYPLTVSDVFSVSPVAVPFFWKDSDESKALFGQIGFKITDRLTATGGVRYTWEKLKMTQLPGGLWFMIFGGPTPEKTTFSKPSWTVGLDYQATPDLLLYVTSRGSWRTGGFNGFTPPIPVGPANGGNLFAPETTYDVEVGAKFSGRVGDVPVRLNVAGYNQWVKKIQRTVYFNIGGQPSSLTANVPEAQITGVEVDGSIRPASWLDLGGKLSYINARFTAKVLSFFGTTVPFGPYPDTPKWSGSVYAQVTVPLGGDWGSLSVRGDVYAQTAQYFSSLNATLAPGTRLPGYALVNLRAEWQEPFGKPLTIGAFVRNVGNRAYYVGGLADSGLAGYNSASWGQPRMYGVEARINF